MRSQPAITALVVLTTILTAGCEFENKRTIASPSALPPIMLGRWSTADVPTAGTGPAGFPTKADCSSLTWNVTSQTGTSIAGEFEATCTGGVALIGTASGNLASDVLTWQAAGDATIPNLATCPFTLNGTARYEGTDSIRVDYTGSTCLGPISGTEILEKS